MKGELKLDFKANVGHFDIIIPFEELENIAEQLTGQPVYDNIENHSINHVIGKIISAKVIGSHIEYEAILNDEGKKFVKKETKIAWSKAN